MPSPRQWPGCEPAVHVVHHLTAVLLDQQAEPCLVPGSDPQHDLGIGELTPAAGGERCRIGTGATWPGRGPTCDWGRTATVAMSSLTLSSAKRCADSSSSSTPSCSSKSGPEAGSSAKPVGASSSIAGSASFFELPDHQPRWCRDRSRWRRDDPRPGRDGEDDPGGWRGGLRGGTAFEAGRFPVFARQRRCSQRDLFSMQATCPSDDL